MIGTEPVTAVVIGRAGSKGLPGKNSRLLCGCPMVCFPIQHAQRAHTVDRVVVSTDGEAIADAARSMSAEVVMRPAELATDTATVDSAVRHALQEVGDAAPIVVILYANVPVRPPDLIDEAVRTLVATGSDSVQSYCEVGKYHPYWMMRIDERQRVQPYVENSVYRRQDLPALYIPDGGVIAVRRDSLLQVDPGNPHAFLGTDRAAVMTEPGTVIDVDSETDARVAEVCLELQAPAPEAH